MKFLNTFVRENYSTQKNVRQEKKALTSGKKGCIITDRKAKALPVDNQRRFSISNTKSNTKVCSAE